MPARLGGLGFHSSDRDGAACDAAFLAAAALTHRAVSGGSEPFDPCKVASGDDRAGLWSDLYDLYDRVQPLTNAPATSALDAVLTDSMVENVLPGFAHSLLAELSKFRQVLLMDGLPLKVTYAWRALLM